MARTHHRSKPALEALDQMRQTQEQIRKDGLIGMDKFGQMKAHPLVVVECDSRSQMLAALKALNLDLEPLRNVPGRPAGR